MSQLFIFPKALNCKKIFVFLTTEKAKSTLVFITPSKVLKLGFVMILLFLFSGNELYAYNFTRPSRTTIIAALNAQNLNFEHPRLYVRKGDFDILKQKVVSDPQMASWYAKFLATADRYVNIDTNPPDYKSYVVIQNGYLTSDYTRYFPTKMMTLALAYQMTGQQKYADRAYKEMLALDAIPDWTSTTYGYHLNTADIMWGFAVAYDWCYAAYTPSQRVILKNNMRDKGLKKLIAMYNADLSTNPKFFLPFSDGNHNPWDNGGASVAALAIGDEEPIIAGELLERALVVAENWVNNFGLNGHTEGPGYSNQAESLFIKWLAGMESALGTSYNLSSG